jgi:hypothetical protein
LFVEFVWFVDKSCGAAATKAPARAGIALPPPSVFFRVFRGSNLAGLD